MMNSRESSSADHHDIVESDESSENSTCTEDTNSSIACSSSSDGSCCSCSSSSSSSSGESKSDSSISTAESDELSPQEPQCEDEYAAQVQLWTVRVPIGLGLCPWAMKSHKRGRLRYRTCEGNLPSDVAILILSEAKALCLASDAPPLSSSLIVCPHVTAWIKDFQAFDDFVRSFGTLWNEHLLKQDLQHKVTLVSFHPEFLRWRGLPKGIKIGSVVQSHKGMDGFQKSQHVYSATVIETSNPVFGLRKIKVRFHDDLKEQYVPIDWFAVPQKSSVVKSSGGDDGVLLGPPLPDNAMHRAPYPTVHLIRNEDLGTLCIRDVSRVKRKNAQRMMKLGWEGILRKAATEKNGV
jgi:hypothetical protein